MTAKTWDELYGDKAQTPAIAPEPLDLSALEGMSKKDLIALIRRSNAILGAVSNEILTKDEKRERMKAKIFAIAMNSENEAIVIKAANDWLDREDGKAGISIKQEVMGDQRANYNLNITQLVLESMTTQQIERIMDNALTISNGDDSGFTSGT